MANALAPQKNMTIGEGGLSLALVGLAILSIVIAAKAYTPEYAFHAYLFTAAMATVHTFTSLVASAFNVV